MHYFTSFALIIFFLLAPGSVFAGERLRHELSSGVVVSFVLPSERWQVTATAPEALVRETVEHVRYHFAEDGREAPPDLEEKVRQRLKQNELFIYNASSSAHLDIDFSPTPSGEDPPDEKTIRTSAGYAADELAQEKDLSDVKSHYAVASVEGTLSVYRIDATYLKDKSPRTFIGYVGATPEGWFFLYYTDKQKVPQDLKEIEILFASFRFERSAR